MFDQPIGTVPGHYEHAKIADTFKDLERVDVQLISAQTDPR